MSMETPGFNMGKSIKFEDKKEKELKLQARREVYEKEVSQGLDVNNEADFARKVQEDANIENLNRSGEKSQELELADEVYYEGKIWQVFDLGQGGRYTEEIKTGEHKQERKKIPRTITIKIGGSYVGVSEDRVRKVTPELKAKIIEMNK